MEEIWKIQSTDPDNLNKISSEYIVQSIHAVVMLMGKNDSKGQFRPHRQTLTNMFVGFCLISVFPPSASVGGACFR